ncbi:hypothetical protein [uncultured Proteiniphilum sp.]|uniref:hypothetical protein n=1 Tax=uncultured Proteiniphilum sp. TaxID=497637 RepID=UPI00262307F9|nr:hypothetical protein [uncultured Proteiniphilum sp.]
MKKNLLLPALILAVLFIGCNEEIVKSLILVDYVELNASTDATLDISAGNPPYQIVSSDNTIATATVDGSSITIKGHKEGKTTLLLTDSKTQNKNIQVKVGVPPVEFARQYSPETMKTVLSDFGISWEETSGQIPNDINILIKSAEADKLVYFKSSEWPIITSEEIKKMITSDSPIPVGNEGIKLKANKEELFHHYFGVNFKGSYYLFHISSVNKKTDSTEEIFTTLTGEYKKAR